MVVCVHLWRRLGKKLFQAIDQLLKSGISGEESLDLGTKISTFPAGLLVRKYVVIILHKVDGVLCRDHNIDEELALRGVCWRFVKDPRC